MRLITGFFLVVQESLLFMTGISGPHSLGEIQCLIFDHVRILTRPEKLVRNLPRGILS